MTNDQQLAAMEILNDPSITWKVKRALLQYKVGLPEPLIAFLVPAEEVSGQ